MAHPTPVPSGEEPPTEQERPEWERRRWVGRLDARLEYKQWEVSLSFRVSCALAFAAIVVLSNEVPFLR